MVVPGLRLVWKGRQDKENGGLFKLLNPSHSPNLPLTAPPVPRIVSLPSAAQFTHIKPPHPTPPVAAPPSSAELRQFNDNPRPEYWLLSKQIEEQYAAGQGKSTR
jgi:hypothetical protein